MPLLGGHHGANRLARELAAHLGGTAALTTASDSKFTRGLDDPPPGWVLADPAAAKPAMTALLIGAKLLLEGHAPWLAEAGYPVSSMARVHVPRQRLMLQRPRARTALSPEPLVAGMRCRARCSRAEEVIALIEDSLASQNLARNRLLPSPPSTSNPVKPRSTRRCRISACRSASSPRANSIRSATASSILSDIVEAETVAPPALPKPRPSRPAR